jgi:fibronectin type III domain protein
LPATGSATLSWTLNSESDLAGYKIYLGTAPGLYTYAGSPIVVGVTGSYTLMGLPMGQTYYFAVSAFNSSGIESELSAEVSKSIY